MKVKLALLAWVCCSIVVAANEKSSPSWKEFTSEEGGYSVLFPGTPKAVKQTVKSAAGNIDTFAFTLEAGKDASYVVSFFDLPAGLTLPLETATKAYVVARKGNAVSERKLIIMDQYPGREVLIQLPGKERFSRLRIYAVQDRQYQIIVEGPKTVVTSDDADKFFESFKLTK